MEKMFVFLRILPVLIIVSNCFPTDLCAKPGTQETIQVDASNVSLLQTLMNRQKIEAMLIDGTYVKGKVIHIEDGEVCIRVTESTVPTALDDGEHLIDTQDFSTVFIRKYKGNMRWVLSPVGVALGFLAGIGPAVLMYDDSRPSAGAYVVLVATPIGCGFGGYYLGRKLDQHDLTILIKRKPTSAQESKR